MTRRGVTLLELMLVLCLLGIVGSTVTAMVVAAGRMGARAMIQLTAERTVQVTAAFFRHELATSTWAEVTVVADSVTMARPVGEGAVCDSSGAFLWVRRGGWTGERAPDAARDRLVVWPDGGVAPSREALIAVTGATCPDAGPAWRLTRGAVGAIGGWVRTEEPTTVRRYRAGSSDWLGLIEGGAPVQPFAGPLLVGASLFAQVGSALQLDLVTPAGWRGLTLPLRAGP
jgi:prepilin-type N-terminal cleavage/methylation domain-containing protein